jgi:hypothetical protein
MLNLHHTADRGLEPRLRGMNLDYATFTVVWPCFVFFANVGKFSAVSAPIRASNIHVVNRFVIYNSSP